MHRLRTLLTVLLLAIPANAPADPDPWPASHPPRANGGPRVRPYDTRSAGLVLEGLRRSATVRALLDALEKHDVIVYVQMQPALKGRLAGSLTWLTATGRFRYVRISVSPTLRGPAAVAALGHELQHALEVAHEPSIVDAQSLTAHYKRIGISMSGHPNGWDTEAARHIGEDVRQDLANSRNGPIVESIRDFDPREWHIVYRRAREEWR